MFSEINVQVKKTNFSKNASVWNLFQVGVERLLGAPINTLTYFHRPFDAYLNDHQTHLDLDL